MRKSTVIRNCKQAVLLYNQRVSKGLAQDKQGLVRWIISPSLYNHKKLFFFSVRELSGPASLSSHEILEV